MRIRQIIVSLAALLFAAVGLALWVAPERAALRFHVEAIGVRGLTTLRADLGGLFVGVAALMLLGAWMKRASMLIGAALIFAAVAAGRVIGWIASGPAGASPADLAIELGAIALLMVCARGVAAQESGSRRSSKGAVVAGVVGIVVVAAVAALLNPRVQWWIFERAARQVTASLSTTMLDDDAMRVLVCGSSAPLPSIPRANAGVAVFAGGKFYLVDVGTGSVENLSVWGVPLSAIGGVLITHFHSDHIGDLGELNLQTWAGGRSAPLPVYGGPGIEQVVEGFSQAYRYDQGYRTAHHTAQVMPPEAWPMIAHAVALDGPETPEKSRTAIVLDDGSLRITAVEVDHPPIAPAYAYRFDYKGRSVLVTGDTKFHPPIARAAKGADVLVSEAIARPMIEALERGSAASKRDRVAHIMHDVQDYHVSPQEAAGLANDAGVKLLVFYHLLPAPDGFLPRSVFAQGVNEVRKGDWVIADDGSLYTLPIGSDDVRIGRMAK